jgi:hypothetical protein
VKIDPSRETCVHTRLILSRRENFLLSRFALETTSFHWNAKNRLLLLKSVGSKEIIACV